MTQADLISHKPSRPSWRCAACGNEYPCRAERKRYLGKIKIWPTLVRILFDALCDDARHDLGIPMGTPEYDALRKRFLGWLPPRKLAVR